jgi:phosphoglycolate phosphatase-like HAD superfamily hydrolase
MNRAFDDLFGIAGAFDSVPMAGRTDKWILDDAAGRAGITLTADDVDRFRDRYRSRLLEALPEPGLPPSTHARGALSVVEGPKGVLPGVRGLLEIIDERAEIFSGLLTGNSEEGARIKLEHFDLWKFFRCGAFGDDVADRNYLFEVAVRRAQACGARDVRRAEVVVVGDTVLDVACARAAGARSVAVATGPSDVETLRASGADLVLADLSDTSAFLRFVSVQT